MKWRAASAPGLIAAVFSASALSQQAPESLLKNGGFEEADPNAAPVGWVFASPQAEQMSIRRIADKPREGSHCLRIAGESEWAAAFQKVPLDRSRSYTLTGYLRHVKGFSMIKLDYFNGDQWLGQTLTELVQEPTGQWQRLTVTSEAAQYPQATHIAATVAVGGDAECDFDALVLTAK
jgi:hypothetical protein